MHHPGEALCGVGGQLFEAGDILSAVINANITLNMPFTRPSAVPYPDRLATFRGHWDDVEATARQLAAVGHVCDRPPLEALEAGSHCISCGAFVKKEDSVRALEAPISIAIADYHHGMDWYTLHHPLCDFLQVRIPLDLQTTSPSVGNVSDIRNMWERRSRPLAPHRPGERQKQSSSLFALPIEIRLEIYSMILPIMDRVTPIVPLNKQSVRVVTQMGFERTGPRDMTKNNLLSTCRAVHEEALDILFAATTYKFATTKLLYLFLRHIGSHGRRLLKHVDVTIAQREDAVAFSLLATCPKLTTITLRLPRPVLLKPPCPLWVVEGVGCLLELSGLTNVQFGTCPLPNYLDETKADAQIVKRELTRPRSEVGGLRWVNGYLDI